MTNIFKSLMFDRHFRLLAEIVDFWAKFSNFRIFVQNFVNFAILTEILKFSICWPKFSKVWCLTDIFSYWPKLKSFDSKFSNFRIFSNFFDRNLQILDFWAKFCNTISEAYYFRNLLSSNRKPKNNFKKTEIYKADVTPCRRVPLNNATPSPVWHGTCCIDVLGHRIYKSECSYTITRNSAKIWKSKFFAHSRNRTPYHGPEGKNTTHPATPATTRDGFKLLK